jgi:hypothetical protein
MTSTPNVLDFATTDATDATKVTKGDMAVVVRLDGTVGTLAFDANVALLSRDLESLDDAEIAEYEQMIEQGERVFALTLAATNPLIMAMLMEVASNPDVVDIGSLTAAAKRAAVLH